MRYQFEDAGLVDYQITWDRMRAFVDTRSTADIDQIWYVQHPPVYTLGRNARRENLLIETDIPVIQTDRGGDITYHGPGQVVLYSLFDLRRSGMTVKTLVYVLEQAVIQFLAGYDIEASRLDSAPGVYVQHKKIASLGLRVRKGCSYHGIAINVDMDLQPFQWIHPCGLQNMQVTQFRQLGIEISCAEAASEISANIATLCDEYE